MRHCARVDARLAKLDPKSVFEAIKEELAGLEPVSERAVRG
jgi:hypothetical protein